MFSPVDLIPDVLPVIGAADDLVLVPLAIRWLLQRLPPDLEDASHQRLRAFGVPSATEPAGKPSIGFFAS